MPTPPGHKQLDAKDAGESTKTAVSENMFQRTNKPGEALDDSSSNEANSRRYSAKPADNSGSDPDSHEEIGVNRVEAFNRQLYQSGKRGKLLLWLLAISIGLTMFAYALDMGITTGIFSTLATSSFGVHSELGAVSTASQIIRAVSKPFIGKLADITSRPTTYIVILAFYAVGFAVAASARDFAAYTVGICFTSVGKSGLDLLSDIIVADLTPLEWRGFFSACLSLPFVVTVPVNGFIAEGFVDNWRWGLGMFAILVPALLIPAIMTLYSMQRRGEKAGMVTMADSKDVRTGAARASPKSFRYWARLAYQGLIDIDIVGLVILGLAFSLILLPFTLAKKSPGGWGDSSMIAMLVTGFVCLVIFVLFEVFLAPKPIMTRRILQNRAFVAGVVIHTFNQMASSVRNTYFSSYIFIIKDWTVYQWTIFLGITTMGLCLVGPVVGLVHRVSHRYKTLMVIGAAAKIVGYGILVQSNGNMTQDTARLVSAQLIFCLASLNIVGARVGVQASVPHEDVATIISIITLWSTLGSSIGSAVASVVWTNQMLDQMREELPGVPDKTILKIYGNIKTLRTKYGFMDPIRQGSIRAYAIVNGHITVASVCLAGIPLIASFFMPNYYLGKQQNAVNNKGLDGQVVDVPDQRGDRGELTASKPEPVSLWQRVLALYRS
ncbi:Major facilitator superfamily domain, general substrate transporter [Metarhizium album ARSEF 1941]|uniref:Major facilitator superfamily domain, general substrate transporter n=1 Tax=Metarhizium album (strain ARSEF 1941) TaxID=1081103 RepID=A0A0B2WT83_METAS|nr:Major facilitator superfamily domain, general substrate transporter [Metarhizium album ARSEF 1941]KHN96180.1 Major facilitator superfamily domain, general substrate transporter [Metarhizium album ARSEF 1941]